MRSDEILTRLRTSAFIGDASAYVDYDDQSLLDEVNDRLRSVFSDQIISARSGYWLMRDLVFASAAGDTRVPSRAVVGGLEAVDYFLNGQYWHLSEMTPREANAWPTPSAANGLPIGFWCSAENINLVPVPATGTQAQLRLRYYLRPSLLVKSQSSTVGGAFVDRGRVTAVDPVARKATVNAIPFDYSPAAGGVVMTSGALIDVVRPTGWHQPTVIDLTGTFTGLVYDFASQLSQDRFGTVIQVGDYIRARDQTDWPALPSDFHRLLADAAAVNVLREMSLDDKASVLSTAASADFQRFAKLISPRVKSEPQRIRHRPYWMRDRW